MIIIIIIGILPNFVEYIAMIQFTNYKLPNVQLLHELQSQTEIQFDNKFLKSLKLSACLILSGISFQILLPRCLNELMP